MPGFQTTKLAGLPIAALNLSQTAALMIERSLARRGQGGPCEYHSAANGQVVAECRINERLSTAVRAADLVSADSMPMVFASKLFGEIALPGRVTTTDLFSRVAELAQDAGVSFYLLGGDESTNRRAAERLVSLYPRLKLAGRRNGFFGPTEESSVVTEINSAAPDILWVGMGVPLQEEFAVRNRAALSRVGVLKTCGGCFRYLSGELRRAPIWIQHAGLEWLFLTFLDPRNRAVRYARTNPIAMYLIIANSELRMSFSKRSPAKLL